MGGCFSTGPQSSAAPSAVLPTGSPRSVGSEVVLVKAQPLPKGRQLRKHALESLLLASTTSWRDKLNALSGNKYSLVSLFIYSSDYSHAVALHSAGPAASLVPPGLVQVTSPGSSHAVLLESKKPLAHTQATPLEPLPYDWNSVDAFEDASCGLLLPLRRAEHIFGSVLVLFNEGESGSCAGLCEDDRRAGTTVYELEELELLAQCLSVGLLNSAVDLEVMQLVANAATLIQRALTIQDAVACLAEAVQGCLRLSTRLELECLPAVAFRGCQVAAFFRSQPSPQPPLDLLTAQRQALAQQAQLLSHSCVSRPQSRTLGNAAKWFIDDHSGMGPTCPCSLGASGVSLQIAGQQDQLAVLRCIDRDLGPAASAVPAAAAAQMLQEQQQQQSTPQPAQQPRMPGSFLTGGGAIRSRLASPAWMLAQREGLEAAAAAASCSGGLGGGAQSPRGHLSAPLQPAGLAGAKVRATVSMLHQTLLAQHLDHLSAAAAAAAASGGASGLGGGTRGGTGTGFMGTSYSGYIVAGSGRAGGLPAGGSRAASRLLPASSDQASALAVALAGRGISACDASVAGSDAVAGGGGGAAVGDSRRLLSVAVVPNCAAFLMADERQPYKDVLHVQRMLPQSRAHSLVMVVSGAMERPCSGHESHLLQTQQSHAMQPLPGSNVRQQVQLGSQFAPLRQQGRGQHVGPHEAATATVTPAAAVDTPKSCSESGAGVRAAAAALHLHSGGSPAAAAAAAAALPSAVSNRGGIMDMPLGTTQGGVATGLAAAAAAGASGSTAATASLALYVVSAESVPRVILEHVAEETRHLVQVLHVALATALTGPCLASEWARFTLLVLGKASAAGGTGTATAAVAAVAAAAASIGCINTSNGGVGGRQLSLPASGAYSLSHLQPIGMDASTQTLMSADILDDAATTVSVVFDGAANANTGTLSMMISSMRDMLSTVQLERTPDSRPAALDDIHAVRLLKVIGRGGQGMVFQGQMYNTVVAVKIIPSSDDVDCLPAHAAHAGDADKPAAAGAAPNGGGDGGEAAQKLQQRQKRWLVRDALEVAVTSTISHPHIVQVLNFFTDALVVEYSNDHGRYRLMPREDNPTAKGASNTAIVMEYCDAGTLKQAVDNGCFRMQRAAPGTAVAAAAVADVAAAVAACGAEAAAGSNIGPGAGANVGSGAGSNIGSNAGGSKASSGAGGGIRTAVAAMAGCLPGSQTNMVALLTSLLEVASGLRHLHENRLVHCDIKPSNVLLRSCTADVRGWVCKLSDFGCVRLMNDLDPNTGRPAFHSLSPVGSLSYMAPESMFRDTFLDSSIDIYSFGIMMWECTMGQLPYAGVPAQQLPSLVRRGLRPSFHQSVPQEYRQIACLCWAQDPRRRPTAAALVQLLQRMLAHTFEEVDAAEMLLHAQQQPQAAPSHHYPQYHSHQHPQHHAQPQQAVQGSSTNAKKPVQPPLTTPGLPSGSDNPRPGAHPHPHSQPAGVTWVPQGERDREGEGRQQAGRGASAAAAAMAARAPKSEDGRPSSAPLALRGGGRGGGGGGSVGASPLAPLRGKGTEARARATPAAVSVMANGAGMTPPAS